jgi:hypothetical protein
MKQRPQAGLSAIRHNFACRPQRLTEESTLRMHRFRSSSTIFRFRIASALLILAYPLALAAVLLLIGSFLQSDPKLALLVPLLFGLVGVTLAIQWGLSRRTHCPLCMTPVLATKHCSKHRKARKLLGSHRLRAAVAVLFLGSFTCPYCNERSELKVREKRQ